MNFSFILLLLTAEILFFYTTEKCWWKFYSSLNFPSGFKGTAEKEEEERKVSAFVLSLLLLFLCHIAVIETSNN